MRQICETARDGGPGFERQDGYCRWLAYVRGACGVAIGRARRLHKKDCRRGGVKEQGVGFCLRGLSMSRPRLLRWSFRLRICELRFVRYWVTFVRVFAPTYHS